VWLESAQKQSGEELDINWRGFILEQINTKQEPGWKVWDQPDDYEFRSLWALRAGEAAKMQGKEAFQKFHMALLRARHEARVNIGDRDAIMEVAGTVGLDLEKLRVDMEDPAVKDKVVADHLEAVESHGVFGTPTFVFPNGAAAFVKMIKPPEGKAARVLELLSEMMSEHIYIGEVKRPQPPWPKGAFTAGQ
jgi:predicted DsbA family dithiol-disulfide isomerase